MSRFINAIRTLVYPASCIMCGNLNSELCLDCNSIWRNSSKNFRLANHIVAAGLTYNERVARVVLSAKEDNGKFAKKCILLGLDAAYQNLRGSIIIPASTFLISIPSANAANRRRGGNYLFDLSKTFAKDSKKYLGNMLTVPKKPMLTQSPHVKDQSGLSALEREFNMESAINVDLSYFDHLNLSKISVLLMDDVVTSGATLKSAISALEASKITVIGAIAACASQRQMRIP